MLSHIPVLIVLAIVVAGAWLCYPVYDDTLLVVLAAENGPASIVQGHLDRPLVGHVFELLYRLGPKGAGIVVHALSWAMTGALAAWVFGWMFPRLRPLAPAAACFAVAPMLCETQIVLINPVIGGQLGANLVFAALFARVVAPKTGAGKAFGAVFGVAATALAAALSEYAIAAVLAVAALVVLREDEPKNERVLTLAVLALGTIIGSVYFFSVKQVGFRPGTDATALMSDGWMRFVKVPPRLVTSLLRGTVLAWVEELAAVELEATQPASLAGAALGAIAAAAAIKLRAKEELPTDRGPVVSRPFLAGLAAMTVGLLPVLMMGRTPLTSGMISRMWLPVLPVAASLGIYLFAHLVRWRTAPVVLGTAAFVATMSATTATARELRDKAVLARWGAQLRPEVEKRTGEVVVVMPNQEPPLSRSNADDELSVRLSLSWPEELKRRFWVSVDLDQPHAASSSLMRGLKRSTKPDHVLIAEPVGGNLRLLNP